jgi:hypothetical protein
MGDSSEESFVSLDTSDSDYEPSTQGSDVSVTEEVESLGSSQDTDEVEVGMANPPPPGQDMLLQNLVQILQQATQVATTSAPAASRRNPIIEARKLGYACCASLLIVL